MGKAHPSSHGRSYIPNTMFLWLIIQLLMTIKTAHKLLSLTHRNCKGKPNIWILPLLQKNKYGRSQLYRDQIFSHTIYLYNSKFDWCLIVYPIWLVWHTYISHWSTHWSIHWSTDWSTHWTTHNIPNAPTNRGIFFTKKITQSHSCGFDLRTRVAVYKFQLGWNVICKLQEITFAIYKPRLMVFGDLQIAKPISFVIYNITCNL